jgi:hypothetical protein
VEVVEDEVQRIHNKVEVEVVATVARPPIVKEDEQIPILVWTPHKKTTNDVPILVWTPHKKTTNAAG